MNLTVLIWLQFALCVCVIEIAGVRLSRYSDAIVALAYRPLLRVWCTASWASLSLLTLYLLNAVIQFLHKR